MIPARRLALLRAAGLRARAAPTSAVIPRSLISSLPSTARYINNTSSQRADVFHSQLENTPNSAELLDSLKTAPVVGVPQTRIEKIVQRYAVDLPEGKKVRAGDFVSLKPHKVMSHDNTAAIYLKWASLGATKVYNPNQLVNTIDHDTQNRSEANLKKYASIQKFAKSQGIPFTGAGHGIGHQVMVEEGFAFPNTLCVASDSHSNHYGGVGAMGTAVVRTDACSLWATGRTWWQIPPIAKITLTGILPHGVTGKDIITALCASFPNDDVLNHAIEFEASRQTLDSIPIDDRCAIANMTTEFGALAGVFPVDANLIDWLYSRQKSYAALNSTNGALSRFSDENIAKLINEPIFADPGATYAKSLYMNISTLSPFVSGPNSVKIGAPLKDLEKKDIAINKAYLVSCTNSRASDIASAAKVFEEAAKAGRDAKVAPGVEFYIAAASKAEQHIAEEDGSWQTLLNAGARPLPSGCGPCIGLGAGLLEEGEVGISASNRNFKGRMGHPNAQAYLSSPQVVAASAIAGKIAGPGWYQKPEGVEKIIIGEGSGDYEADKALSIEDALDKLISEAESMISVAEKDLGGSSEAEAASTPVEDTQETLTEILPGFPEKIEGEIIFADQDNLNTDGIYPGKYTYNESMSVSQMREVAMENYDPEFRHIAKDGDILVSGFNFGTGSSREQAATALLAKKIPLVVAGSFGNIFSRNSINNALMGVEVPKLIKRLREAFKDEPKQLTRRTGWKFSWDIRRSKVTVTEKDGKTWSQKVGEMPPNVQDIISKGGLENWVKAELAKQNA